MQRKSQYLATKQRQRKRSRRFIFSGIMLFLLLFILIAAGYSSYHLKVPAQFWENVIPIPEGQTVNVVIEQGMTASQAARAFEIDGALESGTPIELAQWMMKFGLDRKIRAGHYSIVPSDPWNIARQLRTLKPALLKAQVLPGLDIFALIDSLESQDRKVTRKAVSEALMNNHNYPPKLMDILKGLPDDEYTRVAFLMPETYMLVDRTADEIVNRASSAWWNHWGEFITSHNLTSNDVREASIVASMVEREVLHDSESRTVAGVIHNRMRRNMLLQIDATVVYAWRLKGRKLTRVLNKDLEIESPYNTYKHSGLPPRPICVPSVEAWGAALDPEFNNYLYYVAGKDGYHYFAKTYKEHVANIKQVRSAK